MVVDTAMVNVPSFGADPHPYRIAAIFWQNAGKQRRRCIQLPEGRGGSWSVFQRLGVAGDIVEEEEELSLIHI